MNEPTRSIHNISALNDGSFQFSKAGSDIAYKSPGDTAAGAALDQAIRTAQALRARLDADEKTKAAIEAETAAKIAEKLAVARKVREDREVEEKKSWLQLLIEKIKSFFMGSQTSSEGYINPAIPPPHPMVVSDDSAHRAPQSNQQAIATPAAAQAPADKTVEQPKVKLFESIAETPDGYRVVFADKYEMFVPKNEPAAQIFEKALAETEKLAAEMEFRTKAIEKATVTPAPSQHQEPPDLPQETLPPVIFDVEPEPVGRSRMRV